MYVKCSYFISFHLTDTLGIVTYHRKCLSLYHKWKQLLDLIEYKFGESWGSPICIQLKRLKTELVIVQNKLRLNVNGADIRLENSIF